MFDSGFSKVNMQSVQQVLGSTVGAASKLFKKASSSAPIMGEAAASVVMKVAGAAARISEASGKAAQAADKATVETVKTASLSYSDDHFTSNMMLKVAGGAAQAAGFADKASNVADKAAEGAAKIATYLSALAPSSVPSTEGVPSENDQTARLRQDGPPADAAPTAENDQSARRRQDGPPADAAPTAENDQSARRRQDGPPADAAPTAENDQSARRRQDGPPPSAAPTTATEAAATTTGAAASEQATETQLDEGKTKPSGLMGRLKKAAKKTLEKVSGELSKEIGKAANDIDSTQNPEKKKSTFNRLLNFAEKAVKGAMSVNTETKEAVKDLKKEVTSFMLSPETRSRAEVDKLLQKLETTNAELGKSLAKQMKRFVPDELIKKLGGDSTLNKIGRRMAGAMIGKKELKNSIMLKQNPELARLAGMQQNLAMARADQMATAAINRQSQGKYAADSPYLKDMKEIAHKVSQPLNT